MSLHPIYYFRGPNYSLRAIYLSRLSLLSLQINPQTHHTFYKCLHESKAGAWDTLWEHSSFNGVFASAEVIMREAGFHSGHRVIDLSNLEGILLSLTTPGEKQHQMASAAFM